MYFIVNKDGLIIAASSSFLSSIGARDICLVSSMLNEKMIMLNRNQKEIKVKDRRFEYEVQKLFSPFGELKLYRVIDPHARIIDKSKSSSDIAYLRKIKKGDIVFEDNEFSIPEIPVLKQTSSGEPKPPFAETLKKESSDISSVKKDNLKNREVDDLIGDVSEVKRDKDVELEDIIDLPLTDTKVGSKESKDKPLSGLDSKKGEDRSIKTALDKSSVEKRDDIDDLLKDIDLVDKNIDFNKQNIDEKIDSKKERDSSIAEVTKKDEIKNSKRSVADIDLDLDSKKDTLDNKNTRVDDVSLDDIDRELEKLFEDGIFGDESSKREDRVSKSVEATKDRRKKEREIVKDKEPTPIKIGVNSKDEQDVEKELEIFKNLTFIDDKGAETFESNISNIDEKLNKKIIEIDGDDTTKGGINSLSFIEKDDDKGSKLSFGSWMRRDKQDDNKSLETKIDKGVESDEVKSTRDELKVNFDSKEIKEPETKTKLERDDKVKSIKTEVDETPYTPDLELGGYKDSKSRKDEFSLSLDDDKFDKFNSVESTPAITVVEDSGSNRGVNNRDKNRVQENFNRDEKRVNKDVALDIDIDALEREIEEFSEKSEKQKDSDRDLTTKDREFDDRGFGIFDDDFDKVTKIETTVAKPKPKEVEKKSKEPQRAVAKEPNSGVVGAKKLPSSLTTVLEKIVKIQVSSINIDENAMKLDIDTETYKMLLNNYLTEVENYIPKLKDGNDKIKSMLIDAGSLLSLDSMVLKLQKLLKGKDADKTILEIELFINFLKDKIERKEDDDSDDKVLDDTVTTVDSRDKNGIKDENIIDEEQENYDKIYETSVINEVKAPKSLDENLIDITTAEELINLMPAKPVDLDVDRINSELGLRYDIIYEFLKDFLNQTKEHLPILIDSYKNSNFEVMQKTAHMLKGAANNLRLEIIANNLKELQNCYDLDSAERLIKKFASHIKGLEDELNKLEIL